MKVLILSGRFGFGHEMAANAIREEFKRQRADAEIIQKDLPTYFNPYISKIIYKVFGLVAERYHGIYNIVYKISGKMNSGNRPDGPLIYRKFQRMVEECRPDVIVCTHPFCEKSAANYKAKSGSQIPLVTCITDISMHKEWFAKQTDLYLAPTVEVKNNLVSFGALPENILVTGVPVRQQFLGSEKEGNRMHPLMGQKHFHKKEAAEKHVLVMGGGLGIMPELEEILNTLHETPGVKATVITGKNQKTYQMWKGHFDDVEVLGYVDDIGNYMRKSDLVITKAGGITLFELLHSKVPMFIIRPFLEQETVNARYAQGKGFAHVVWDKKEDFKAELRNLLKDTERLEKLRENMVKAHEEMIDAELSQAVWEMSKRGQDYKENSKVMNFFRIMSESSKLPLYSILGESLQGGTQI